MTNLTRRKGDKHKTGTVMNSTKKKKSLAKEELEGERSKKSSQSDDGRVLLHRCYYYAIFTRGEVKVKREQKKSFVSGIMRTFQVCK
jgi:hypothetical protein